MKTWRDLARPIIAEVVRSLKGCDPKFVKKAVMATYPWGERRYWPYKVWCDEARRQLHLKHPDPDPRQLDLPDSELFR